MKQRSDLEAFLEERIKAANRSAPGRARPPFPHSWVAVIIANWFEEWEKLRKDPAVDLNLTVGTPHNTKL